MGNRRNRQAADRVTVKSADLTAGFSVRYTVKNVGLCVFCCLVLLTVYSMRSFYTTNSYKRLATFLHKEHLSSSTRTPETTPVRMATFRHKEHLNASTRTPETTPVSLVSGKWNHDSYTARFFRDTYPEEGSFISFKGGKKAELTFRINPNYVPSKCPDSIQKKMSNNSKGATIFHPEIHQLANSQLLNTSEYNRLRPNYMPFGYKTKSMFALKDVQASLKLFPAKDSIFDFSDEKQRPRCLSCAVVCNGGILNGSGNGQEIDSHDMVFRVNNAIRRNHTHDVGNRTTHYIFYDRSLRHTSANDVPNNKGLIYIFLPCRDNDYKYIAAVVQGKDPKITVAADKVRILHPDFVRYIHEIWIQNNKKTFRPTTGAIMLLTALHSGCDRVNVYGMGYTDKYTYYYYDAKFTKTYNAIQTIRGTVHDIKAELHILQGLDRIGAIDWYKRNVSSFQTN